MLFLSTRVETYLEGNGNPNIQMLTLVFFILNFLAATQDIAVDGWALTMLHRLYTGYESYVSFLKSWDEIEILNNPLKIGNR